MALFMQWYLKVLKKLRIPKKNFKNSKYRPEKVLDWNTFHAVYIANQNNT